MIQALFKHLKSKIEKEKHVRCLLRYRIQKIEQPSREYYNLLEKKKKEEDLNLSLGTVIVESFLK